MIHRPRKPKRTLKVDFVISVDRCMMSNYHNHEFLGFLATGPAVGLPESVWVKLACPNVEVDEYGRPKEAPYGLRKIEAKLQDSGFRAYVIDPDYVPYYLRNLDVKALMIGHHDYFAMGPPSNEWWMITGRKPINAKSFEEFISFPEIWYAKSKRALRVIVGGPAAWQWLVNRDALRRWPVDTVVLGEAENAVVELAEKVLRGEDLPARVEVRPQDAPELDDIPAIKGASVNGLVEIMRGCPRGCKFCSVTARPLRYVPLDTIEREIRVNVSAGVGNVVLHSEDVLLYGADGVRPRPEPLIKLHRMVLKYDLGLSWSHVSLASVKYAENEHRLISRLTEMVLDGVKRRFIGVEVGIETGSPRLAEKIMPGKAAPYSPREWPSIVEEAFAIMHEHNIVPAATFILGLPGETPDDVVRTVELIESLRPYRSLIVPMFFVPMGALKDKAWFSKRMLRREHIEALEAALEHSVYWASRILPEYLWHPKYLPVRALLKAFIKAVEVKAAAVRKRIEAAALP